MTEDLKGCEIVFDGCRWGIVDEDLGQSCIVCDQDGGDHLIAKSRIDSVTKLKPNEPTL